MSGTPSRSRFARFLLVAAVSSALPGVAGAADLPDDQMTPYQFSAVLNADNVYVRSYAGEDQYPVVKLNKGQPVTVVGAKGDWLKVLPPEGVYCLVGKPWIDLRGDGKVGRCNDGDHAIVRIASLVSSDSYGHVTGALATGQDVKVLGLQDTYYKVAPPPGAFAYVHKRFVTLVKQVKVVTDDGVQVVRAVDAPTPVAKTDEAEKTSDGDRRAVAVVPTTKPADDASAVAVTTPATQPTAAVAAGFDAAEAAFVSASKLRLDRQPLDEVKARYAKLAGEASLTEQQKKIVDYRLQVIALRQDAARTLAAAGEARKKQEGDQTALAAEAQEMTQRIAANQSKRYAAVGTLRASALPFEGRTLYRLTDPNSGRTVVYVATTDPKVIAMDGSFVGVRGTVRDDVTRQIKLISPDTAEAVDPADLANGSVSSGLVPASMQPTASIR